LATEQERKLKIEASARGLKSQRDEAIQQFHSSHNLLQKAMHYRDAAAAVELLSLTPVMSVDHVPRAGQTIDVQGGFVLSQKGTVWTMNGPNKVVLGELSVRAIPATRGGGDE
jgi:hypothetical protein